jgi:hypothetical protein
MRIAPGRVVLGLAACLICAGCQRADPAPAPPDIALAWTVAPDPPAVGPARVSLTLTDSKTGEPVRDAEVRLEGNMSHAGMKPVLGTAREVEPGRYEATIELTMGGDWFLLVEADLEDGRALGRQVELPGVRPRS